MKSTKIIHRSTLRSMRNTLFILVILLFSSCGGKDKAGDSSDSLSTDMSAVQEKTDGILSMAQVTFTDTLTIDGKLHEYTIDITPVDSLPLVINAEGVKYHDNSIRLTITRSAKEKGSAKETVFDHLFTKQSFADYLDDIDPEKVALVNCRYNIENDLSHPALSFVAYVADPDDNIDVGRNIEIRILSDGKYSLKVVEEPEMDPISSSNRLNPERYE